ncbi:MAG: response regulator [Candidatus Omnitrophica bacterium]|nr:response regulator [Candidatus Omnitrophota bacterium]
MKDNTLAVLLVEDNPEVASLMRAMLKKAKSVRFDITTADTLESGLNLLKTRNFDGILLDLTLPDSNGLETVRSVHAQAANIPIIVLTGVDDEHIATNAVREGAQDYIVKGSADINGLIRSVLYAIERKHAEEELRQARDELELRVKERTEELQRTNEFLAKEVDEHKQTENQLRIANSRLQSTQAQLIQAAKMEVVGGLASGVAHEVKNPLAIILQGVEYLERKTAKDDQSVATTIGYIRNAVERADNIVRGLMDFSSISQLNMQKQQIVPILEKALMLLKHQFDKQHIKLVKKFADNLPELSIDRNKIEQVFLNLLMNAADAMDKGGTLTVCVYQQRQEQADSDRQTEFLVIQIIDQGSGISDQVKNSIFDPFFTTKRTKGGTGLGLPIVRNILETHKAVIEIKNNPDRGAQVLISFAL